jgi:hypothetical protein
MCIDDPPIEPLFLSWAHGNQQQKRFLCCNLLVFSVFASKEAKMLANHIAISKELRAQRTIACRRLQRNPIPLSLVRHEDPASQRQLHAYSTPE